MLFQTKKCSAHKNIMKQEHACTKQLQPFTGKNLTGNEENTRPEMKKKKFFSCLSFRSHLARHFLSRHFLQLLLSNPRKLQNLGAVKSEKNSL
jgi:hypothetical protein